MISEFFFVLQRKSAYNVLKVERKEKKKKVFFPQEIVIFIIVHILMNIIGVDTKGK